jgi:TolA-binding protein
MEGLQGWMAEIERKQDRMTKIGGGAGIVAVLASAAALALGVIGMQSNASDDDLDELRDSVNALSGEVEAQTEQQLGGLNQKITALESQVKSLQQQQQQNAQTIAGLQSQPRAGDAGVGAGAGAGALPAVPTPGDRP